jgi:hypothetical protein
MKQVKEDFIGIVVEEMKNTKLFTQEEMVYALVVLEQRLEEYESFLKDLEKNKDNLYVYIDKEEEDSVINYKYRGGDFSILYNYIISPFCNWAVELLTTSLA